jgi:uncharacterized protein (DUF952 family)
MSGFIYHITTRSDWQQSQLAGEYCAATLTSTGFMHCSSKEQVIRVANNFYHNQAGLVLLEIDPTRVCVQVCWEPGTDAPEELFPHIYGHLNLDAITRVLEIDPKSDGSFTFPQP